MKVIMISGPTGSGKTTISNKISKEFSNSFILNTDNYYKTGLKSKIFSILVKCYFDKLISFNYKLFKEDFEFILKKGASKHSYSYDFNKKKTIKTSKKLRKINFLIIEGIFAREVMQDFYKYDVYFIELKMNKHICMERVIRRDIDERGKSEDIAKNDFSKSWEIYYSKNKYRNLTSNPRCLICTEKTDIIFELKKVLNQ